ncbi:MAG: TRAP transporter fused permease subunit [Paracoccaceae bacterium]|nr:TRAP transporter fused permease subunit [Paracoccaceae bacterium]
MDESTPWGRCLDTADRMTRALRLGTMAVAVAMSVYHMAVAYIGTPMADFHYPVHVAFALVVLFLGSAADTRAREGDRRWALHLAWDLALVFVSFAACAYLFLWPHYPGNRFIYVQDLTWIEIFLGTGLILALMEAARRTVGWVLVIVLVVFVLYAVFGNHLPGALNHNGFTIDRVLEQSYLTQDGIWNQPIAVTANYIFLFVLLGSLLLSSGAGTFFTELASSMTRRAVGGPAKTSVVASTFMGMLSGSSPANVVTTGSFTIPAMRKAGYRPDFAAGVEATASTGGQLTPPIMGAAAFLMVEFAGVPYTEVMRVAIVPALLYFIAIYTMVHLEAHRLGLAATADDDGDTVLGILRRRGYLLLALVVMIWLLWQGYTPTAAGFWAVMSLAGLILVFDPGARRRYLPVLVEAMDHAPRLIAPITVACAIGGIIAGIIIMTGLGVRMAEIILSVSGGSILIALILTMVVAVIMGMGMPTSSAYIVLAVLLAPGLIEMGVPGIAAHLFIIYCAAKSSITPPVAVASYAAAAIAGTNPWTTSLVAFKLGISAFLIPYMFVYGPPLLTYGGFLEVAWACLTASIGIFALSVAVIGWLRAPLGPAIRLLFLACSLTLIYASWASDLLGLALFAAGIGLIELRRRAAFA